MLLWMSGSILCEFSDLRGACDWVSSFERRLERFQRVWINVPWGEHHRSYLLSLMSLWECSGMYLLSRVYCSAGCRDAYAYNSASKLLFLLTFRKIYSYLCKGCWRDATLGLFLTLGVVLFVAEVCSVRLWAHSRLCLLLEASVDLTWSSWLALKVLVLPPQSRGHKERMWVVRQSKHHTAELHLDISVLCLCHPPSTCQKTVDFTNLITDSKETGTSWFTCQTNHPRTATLQQRVSDPARTSVSSQGSKRGCCWCPVDANSVWYTSNRCCYPSLHVCIWAGISIATRWSREVDKASAAM